MKLTIGQLLEQAYLEGWRKGVESYAWWKDGQQLVGSGIVRLSDALKAAPQEAQDYYRSFLERQREKHDDDGA